jgi:CheY-like chemotaxis protein
LPVDDGPAKLLNVDNLNILDIMEYNWKGKVILVAEDVATNYLLVKKSLRKTEVDLIWAKNGQEAVDECKKDQQIDLVLMDIRMPLMNGMEATKQIKAIRGDLPIIAQTAYAMDGDRNRSLEAGCDDYISKPIDLKSFVELISKYISR